MKKLLLIALTSILIGCDKEPKADNIMLTELRIKTSVIAGESNYIVHKIKGTEIRDGVEIDFYDDLKIKAICNYENGKANGIWLRYNRNGELCFSMEFINDKPTRQKICINGNMGDFYTFECGCDL